MYRFKLLITATDHHGYDPIDEDENDKVWLLAVTEFVPTVGAFLLVPTFYPRIEAGDEESFGDHDVMVVDIEVPVNGDLPNVWAICVDESLNDANGSINSIKNAVEKLQLHVHLKDDDESEFIRRRGNRSQIITEAVPRGRRRR